jgi:hypothetical protein
MALRSFESLMSALLRDAEGISDFGVGAPLFGSAPGLRFDLAVELELDAPDS